MAMSLKLFRSTEFAQSRNFSPERQRSAVHPAWIIVATGLWLAIAGNWVLWRSLAQASELGGGAVWWIALRVTAMIASAHWVVLGFFMWRHTLKPAACVLMLATAVASTMLGNTAEFGAWQWPIGLALLAFLPAAWLWRIAVYRLSPWNTLLQAGLLVGASSTVFALALLFSFKQLAVLSVNHAELRHLLSPYSTLGAVAALEKALLGAKQ